MIYAIRADESNHRFVNHSLASTSTLPALPVMLIWRQDLKDQDAQNPFAIREPDAVIRGTVAGFTKEEAQAWAEKTEAEAKALLEQPTKA